MVLFCGSAVEMPWLDKVKAVLYMGLPGQAGGTAAANLLTGAVNPGGKLTETWPMTYADVPSRDTFGKKTTHYKEGLYVGYRYYDKAGVAVRFPFGFGMSYTQFAYSDLQVEGRTVTATITNTGSVPGAEVVQLYVAPPQNGPYRPAKELKGFAKVSLQPGESRTVTFELNDRSFAVWCDGGWKVPMGSYEILVGASSADIRLRATMAVDGVSLSAPEWQQGSWYETLQSLPTDAEFEALYGGPLPERPRTEKGCVHDGALHDGAERSFPCHDADVQGHRGYDCQELWRKGRLQRPDVQNDGHVRRGCAAARGSAVQLRCVPGQPGRGNAGHGQRPPGAGHEKAGEKVRLHKESVVI